MKKIYHLSTCSTCRRILREVEPDNDFVYQDLKNNPISNNDLDFIQKLAGSYLNIFNKQSRKYRELSLHMQELSEEEMRQLILDEYTFLKRPIFIIHDRIFVGNNRKVVNDLNTYMKNLKKNIVNN